MSREQRFSYFLEAIEAGADDRAEQYALQFTPQDAPDLMPMLDSSDGDHRWWSLRALAVCGTPDALAAIAARLEDADPSVRAAVPLAFAHLHQRYPFEVTPFLDPVALRLKDDDGMVRQVAADALALCGDDAVPALARVLFEQAHEGARTRAAGALRKIATMKAAGVLYALLNDENHLVRAYAYEGLDDMGLLETVLVTLQ